MRTKRRQPWTPPPITAPRAHRKPRVSRPETVDRTMAKTLWACLQRLLIPLPRTTIGVMQTDIRVPSCWVSIPPSVQGPGEPFYIGSLDDTIAVIPGHGQHVISPCHQVRNHKSGVLTFNCCSLVSDAPPIPRDDPSCPTLLELTYYEFMIDGLHYHLHDQPVTTK